MRASRVKKVEERIDLLEGEVARLKAALEAALGQTLALVPDSVRSVRRFEAHRLERAGVLLEEEMKSLSGIVDETGRRVRHDLAADMQEGSDCDL